MKFIESSIISTGIQKEKLIEAFTEIPDVIYPEIQAITANKITRNKTYYPIESLIGNPEKDSGVNSLLYPYPIPIIKDHATGGGLFGGESSTIYGRAKLAKFVSLGNGGYVSVIPAITDPYAIEMILSERFLTVSIGVEAESVFCSIPGCGKNLAEEPCDHKKGQTYIIDGRPFEAYLKIGPVWFQEISFVTVPSDTSAKVINKNTQIDNIKILGGESKKKGEYIFSEYKTEFDSLSKIWSIPTRMEVKENKEELVPDTEVLDSKILETNTELNTQVIDEEEDVPCTLGELYGLSEDDLDFNTEAKLSTKQRKALPDTSFCGPGRSFPITSAGHYKVALSMLSRYKGPGNKDRIKACILRKGSKFKKGESTTFKGIPLAILKDEKYLVEYPIFNTTKGKVFPICDTIESSNFPDNYKEELYTKLAIFCKDKKIKRPKQIDSFYKGLDGTESKEPLVIPLNESTYPLLYSYIDAMEQYTMEVSMEKPENKKEESVVEETKIVEVTQLQETISTLNEQIATLNEQIEVLDNRCMEAFMESHVRLATEVSIISKILRRKISHEKSLDELTKEFAKRSKQSLEDSLKDLLLEWDGSSVVNIEELEKIENPVLQSDEAKVETELEVDPATGKTTIKGGLSEVEEETVILFSGMTTEELEKKISNRLSGGSR